MNHLLWPDIIVVTKYGNNINDKRKYKTLNTMLLNNKNVLLVGAVDGEYNRKYENIITIKQLSKQFLFCNIEQHM